MTEEKFFAKVCNEIVIISYKSTENNLEMIKIATRDENIKKINDELEKLSDAELDKVAGGETGKLRDFDDRVSGIATDFPNNPNKIKFETGK